MIGEVVVHSDGQRGTVVGSEFFDPANADYGKKVKVALSGERFVWAIDDLTEAHQKTLRIGRVVDNRNGLSALVVGVPEENAVLVRDIRKDMVWDVADIVRVDDSGSKMIQQDAKIAVLEAELAALKNNPTPSPSPKQQGGEQQAEMPLPVPTVEVKTLIHGLIDGRNGYPGTNVADRELAEALTEGWTVLDIYVDIFPASNPLDWAGGVRVVTLERRNGVQVEQDLIEAVDNTDGLLADKAGLVPTAGREPDEAVAEGAPVVIQVEQPGETVMPLAQQPVVVTFDPTPAPIDNAISFAEALRDPRVSAEEVAQIGDAEAYARGKAVYEGLQNSSYGNTGGRGVPRPYGNGRSGFGGMRRTVKS